MVITRTPFRVSFFGGGTDRYEWFSENEGGVLSCTIDKYCYLTLRKLPPFFEHKHRIVYSKVENVTDIDDIKHPVVREVFRYLAVVEGKELHHDGDLPAGSGLGSSSSFTVGLLMALSALRGRFASKKWLADTAIYIERELLKEAVGMQDQIAVAQGGFNHIKFKKDGKYRVNPVLVNGSDKSELESHLMLFFTGISRFSSDISKSQIDKIEQKREKYSKLTLLLDDALRLFGKDYLCIKDFGSLLNESWLIKRALSDSVTNERVDLMYQKAIECGAYGGKLTGAGGGGFMLICAPPEKHTRIKEALYPNIYVPFKFENSGSSVIYFDSELGA